jgi:hypothetical protein
MEKLGIIRRMISFFRKQKNENARIEKVINYHDNYELRDSLEALEEAGAMPEFLSIIRGDKFIAKEIVKASKEIMQKRYGGEEIDLSYVYPYPEDYHVRPIFEQIALLSKYFDLDGTKALTYAENLPALPEGAEGWFAVPKWHSISKSYFKAVKNMLYVLIKNDILDDERADLNKYHEKMFHRSQHSLLIDDCHKKQTGDIVIFPAQFGFRHRGKTILNAWRSFENNEFDLGLFTIGSMILTHPKRFHPGKYLNAPACSGDYFAFGRSPYELGPNDKCVIPCFRRYENRTKIYLSATDLHGRYADNKSFSVATGFINQPPIGRFLTSVRLGKYDSATELRQSILNSGIKITEEANKIFEKIKISQRVLDLDLYEIEGHELHALKGSMVPSRKQILEYAKKYGFRSISTEAGILARLKCDDKVSRKVITSDGGTRVVSLHNGNNEPWLETFGEYTGDYPSNDNNFYVWIFTWQPPRS